MGPLKTIPRIVRARAREPEYIFKVRCVPKRPLRPHRRIEGAITKLKNDRRKPVGIFARGNEGGDGNHGYWPQPIGRNCAGGTVYWMRLMGRSA